MTTKEMTLHDFRTAIIDRWSKKFTEQYHQDLDTRYIAAVVTVLDLIPSLESLYDSKHLRVAESYLRDIYNRVVNSLHAESDPREVFNCIQELDTFIDAAMRHVDRVLRERYPTQMKRPDETYANLAAMCPAQYH